MVTAWHLAAARHDRIGLLLAATLGVAVLARGPAAIAQVPEAGSAARPGHEVIIYATREADEAVTAKVVQALKENPFIFAEHIEVVTVNGIMTLSGDVQDLGDMRRVLAIARRIARTAGLRRVINRIDFDPADDDDG
jgi:BON domain